MKPIFPLTAVPPGKDVVVVSITGGRGMQAKLTDMGLYQGISLRVIQCAGRGPCVILFYNTRLILGHGMAQKILVKEK